MIAVIDECTISVLLMEDYSSIRNEATEKAVKEIKRAYDSWEHISEEEFFEALDKVLKDFNFKATMKVIKQLQDSEEDRKSITGRY